MHHFPELPGLPLSGNTPSMASMASMPPNMAEALALVRAGRLQEASALLMGKGANDGHSAQGEQGTQGTQGVQSPTESAPHIPPQFAQRFQGLAARGLAGVQDVLNNLELHAKTGAPTPADTDFTQTTAPNVKANANTTTTPKTGARDPGRFERVAFTHQGVSHPYFLYTPHTPAPSGGRPLVLMLHGCTQDAKNFALGTRMNAAAEAAGALVLYPTQGQSANANGCWNWFRPEDQQAGAGEPALLLAMVRHATAAHAVNTQRVYVAGLSAGGAMAALLAQQYPRDFAAVGVHSGVAPGAAQTMMGALSAMKSGAKGWSAQPPRGGARAVPMIVLHGDADSTVHHRNGDQLLQSAAAGVANTVQTREQGVSADGQRYTRTCVVHTAASGTAPGAVLAEHWLLHGAGHAWSGGDARGSHTSAHGVDASAEMLRFFLTHSADGVTPRA